MRAPMPHRHEHRSAPAARAARESGAASRRLLRALLILGGFTLVEAIGGFAANSIALLAEAAHMLTDSTSLVLAIAALHLGRRPASRRRTYGHRRYQPLAAFVNGQVLVLLSAGVLYEAVVRLLHPPQVRGGLMLAVAAVGGAANVAAFFTLSGARSLNERSARLHVLSDLLGSGAACLAALLVLTEGWVAADPLLSMLVAALVLRSAWRILREAGEVLLESVPEGFDVQHIESELVGHVPGVLGVHHVHVWSMTGERPTVTLHADLAPGTAQRAAIRAIQARLAERLDVEHATVQVEEDGCESPPCEPPQA